MSLTTEEVKDIYNNAIVIDGMVGTTYAFDALVESGCTAVNVTLAAHNEDWQRMIEVMKNYYAAIIAFPDKLTLIESGEDIEKSKKEGKVGLIFGLQTSSPVGEDLTNIWLLYKLGVRVMQLTYMAATKAGYGCLEKDQGLTYFGKRMIMAMNQIGMILDLSHCGWKTAEDAIKESTSPVICSHTNPYEKCSTTRNFPDDLIRGIAESGGVMGINAHPAICKTRKGDSQPTLDDYMECLYYMIEVAGIDHVGIGMDLFHGFTMWEETRWHIGGYLLPGGWKVTKDLEYQTDLIKIVYRLAQDGFDKASIEKIIGNNFLRVFKEVCKGKN